MQETDPQFKASCFDEKDTTLDLPTGVPYTPESSRTQSLHSSSGHRRDLEAGLAPNEAAQAMSFGRGRPHPPPLPDREDYVVDFDGPDDASFPQTWPLRTRLFIRVILAFTCISSTFDSAVFSPSMSQAAKHFHVSVEVAALGSSLYIAGYAFGPLV